MRKLDDSAKFEKQREESIHALGQSRELQQLSFQWLSASIALNYTYNFSALGRPIIQFPPDIVAIQELIWLVRPDLIIETGIAHGGSLVLSASMLALLDYCEAAQRNDDFSPRRSARKVLGLDIDIRPHNRAAIEAHPLSHLIQMVEGSSISKESIATVHAVASGYRKVMLFLDSNHSHQHVLQELEAYAPLVSIDSYCIVFDTIVEDLPRSALGSRPWGKGDSPKTAAKEYLRRLDEEGRMASDGLRLILAVDKAIDSKLQISVSPEGYLKRVKEVA